MSILKGPEGGFSSKRAVGLSYALLGIVMVLVSVFTERETDLDILLIVVGTALTSLGISSMAYFGKKDIIQSKTTDPTKPGGPKT